MNRAALKLFPSEKDALEFLEDYDLDEARIKLLRELGRIREAAEVHAKNGDMLKAIEMLTAPGHNADHALPAIKYLLTGLWQNLTLGALPTSNPIVLELLVLADRLDESAMAGPEADEVSIYRPSNQ